MNDLNFYRDIFNKCWLVFKQAYELLEDGPISDRAWESMLECMSQIGNASTPAGRKIIIATLEAVEILDKEVRSNDD